MKNFHKVKALERLYASLSISEFERVYEAVPGSQFVCYSANLMAQDIPYILDVLAKAIAEERS